MINLKRGAALLARSRKAVLMGILTYIKTARLAGDQPPIYLAQ